jgi:hypothetical protein
LDNKSANTENHLALGIYGVLSKQSTVEISCINVFAKFEFVAATLVTLTGKTMAEAITTTRCSIVMIKA